jgi:hypothetical protein
MVTMEEQDFDEIERRDIHSGFRRRLLRLWLRMMLAPPTAVEAEQEEASMR